MASARQPAIPHMHVPNGVCKVLALILRWAGPGVGKAGKSRAARPWGLRCRVGRSWPACPRFVPHRGTPAAEATTPMPQGSRKQLKPWCWLRGRACAAPASSACRKPSLTVRENFAHHWSTGLRDARLDRPSSWGLGCETGGLVGGLSRQEIPRGKQRHMLHQYKVSGCLNEPSAETLFEIMALRCAGTRRKDGCSSSGRAPPGTWPRWRHRHRATPESGGDQPTHPPLRRK
jgi:hypothetical protein